MSNETKKLRLGIVGLGAMGHPHVGFALSTPEVILAALCDSDPARRLRVQDSYFSEASSPAAAPAVSASAQPVFTSGRRSQDFPPTFDNAEDMLDSGLIDAILIAVPHYDHEPIALAALERGIHVLCEKPLTVTTQGARRMIAGWEAARKTKPDLVFAAMFMQRTWGQWKKVKDLIDSGELGKLVRTTWIVTDWFRTAKYYSSGGWRATWNGEGGGVLTNQSPHNLDLLQWFLGMPEKLSAVGGLGKYHDIAVEDEVSATLQYKDGSVAHFITSTAESPGTNRLEIVGENGKLIYEHNTLTFHRNRESMKHWSDTTDQMYSGPECWTFPVPFAHHGESGHRIVLQHFARHILYGEPLVAAGSEGLHQVTLTNAMMVSLLGGGKMVSLADADKFEALLAALKQQGDSQVISGAQKSGMFYAPQGKPNPVVKPGEFAFAATGLDHGHIFGQTNGLTEAGATLKWVWDPDPAKVQAFQQQYPGVKAARSEDEVLQDPEVRLVAAAAVPSDRCALGLKVMASGKDYFTDKSPVTSLAQLDLAKRAAAQTGKKYMVYYSERLHVESAVHAGHLIDAGAIGRVLQVIGLGPHRLNAPSRPPWFFDKLKYGGILCDIGSHQIEQYLHFSGAQNAKVVRAHAANHNHPSTPGLEDFGEAMLLGDNGTSNYFRVDWFTPDGLGTWGDGRTFILGTEGTIELRKYIDVARDKSGDHVYLTDQKGEHHVAVGGKVGFPFFGQLVLDCLNRTETAMTQEHAFKAAELCCLAQEMADEEH